MLRPGSPVIGVPLNPSGKNVARRRAYSSGYASQQEPGCERVQLIALNLGGGLDEPGKPMRHAKPHRPTRTSRSAHPSQPIMQTHVLVA